MTPGGWARADVAIAEGSIAAVGGEVTGDETIDASGCLVGPGFVDLHSHLREPGQTWKEDVASGSRAAAAGGYTAVVAMPNTDPPIDSTKVVELVLSLGAEAGLVDVLPSAALTLGRAGHVASDVRSLYEAGVRVFTDDGDSVEDARLLQQIMETMADLDGAIVAQHAEDAGSTSGGHMHEGPMSQRLGVGGLSAEAEYEVVGRDIDLVRKTGARYHCQHVSSSVTVDLVRAAKREGLPVTAEVTPHHLTFCDVDLSALDTNFKMYPPLRSQDDREALVAGLRDGTIDAVATDHAPHQREEKSVEFERAPRGVIGLETAASATWESLEDHDDFFRVMSSAPSGILGLTGHGKAIEPGNPANLVVFAPRERWTAQAFRSKSANSPYLGREMKGRVRATIYRGRVTYQVEPNEI